MPTIPITAVFYMTTAADNYLILQYADQSRSNPLPDSDSLRETFTTAERTAYLKAASNPNQWVNVN